ncbi:MFS transporter [Rugosimonospora africana]|uniref:MFS transporter n=2 Tax=Rugosimonospora africana TaxID=556532 RepID=A0A8J3R2W4_9ACTN|nr:MFS transporter [Rugosimonospora africana]
MLMLDLTVVYVAMPNMQATYSSSFSALQWVLDAYSIGLAVFLLTAGSLADRLGRKRVFLVGLLIFVLASMVCGLATDVVMLSVARAVQGIGGAVLYAIGPALIGHEYRGRERATAFGVFGAVTGLAIALGPLIGGALTAWDWRFIFLINVPAGLVALVVAQLRLRESRKADARRLDWAGLVIFCLALSLLAFAVLRGEDEGWESALITGAFIGFGVLLALFVVVERRAGERAMLDLRLFRNRTFVGMSVATALCAGSFMFAIFIFTSYLQNILRLSAWEDGVRMLPLTVSLFVSAAASGALASRAPARLVAAGALVAITAGLLLATAVANGSAWTALLPAFVIGGLGMGLFTGRRSAMAIAVVDPSRAGMASGINVTFQQIGTAIGIAGLGAIFQHRASHQFLESSAGRELGGRAAASVAADGGAGLQASIRQPILAAQALRAAQEAYLTAFDVVMVAAAAIALVGAVVAVLLIRTRDLHESATEVPVLPAD